MKHIRCRVQAPDHSRAWTLPTWSSRPWAKDKSRSLRQQPGKNTANRLKKTVRWCAASIDWVLMNLLQQWPKTSCVAYVDTLKNSTRASSATKPLMQQSISVYVIKPTNACPTRPLTWLIRPVLDSKLTAQIGFATKATLWKPLPRQLKFQQNRSAAKQSRAWKIWTSTSRPNCMDRTQLLMACWKRSMLAVLDSSQSTNPWAVSCSWAQLVQVKLNWPNCWPTTWAWSWCVTTWVSTKRNMPQPNWLVRLQAMWATMTDSWVEVCWSATWKNRPTALSCLTRLKKHTLMSATCCWVSWTKVLSLAAMARKPMHVMPSSSWPATWVQQQANAMPLALDVILNVQARTTRQSKTSSSLSSVIALMPFVSSTGWINLASRRLWPSLSTN